MNALYSFFGWFLGWPMWLIYKITSNYGLSLILFTLFMQIVMLPLAINQKKSMAKNLALQPQQENLKKKYGKNPQKLQEEQQKLFEESGYNMMSGCLGPLIQFPILFGLMDVVYRPLSHIVRIPKEVIGKAIEIANGIGANIQASSLHRELNLISSVRSNPSAFSDLDQTSLDQILNLDLSIFGIDSTIIPKLGFTLIAFIPIFSAITSVIQMLYSQHIQKQSSPDGKSPMSGNGTLMMLLIGPGMTLMIGYQFPIGLTIYYVIRNVITLLQEIILNKVMPQEKLVQEAADQMAEHRKKYLGKEKKERKVTVQDDKGNKVEKNVSQREYEKKKLAEARKRDADKYGYSYDEGNQD